jgi:integrase/recombinase XerD
MSLVPQARVVAVFPGFVDLPGRVSPRTLSEYHDDVNHYLNFCAWEKDKARDPASGRAWLTSMVDHSELSPNTINRRLAALRTLIRLSAAYGDLDAARAYGFEAIKAVRENALRHRLSPNAQVWLDPEDVRKIWRTPDASTLRGLRDRALLGVLIASGCRISEAIALRQTDIYWYRDRGTIEILGKGQSRKRRVPLTCEAYAWLERWLRARAAAGVDVSLVFTGLSAKGQWPTGKGLTRQGAYLLIKRICKRAGYPHVKPHDFRRFVGSQLYARHGLPVAQRILGHQRADTTTKYIRPDGEIQQTTEGFV